MANGTPLINGEVHSAASVEIQCNGVTILNVKEINYDTKQEVTEVYGLQANAVGRSVGKITRTADFTIGIEEKEALTNVAPDRDLVKLNLLIIVSYTVGTTPILHKLIDMKPKNNGAAVKSGDNELSYKIELAAGNILY
jgi:hypothetical protein